jgi:hypothetical protein
MRQFGQRFLNPTVQPLRSQIYGLTRNPPAFNQWKKAATALGGRPARFVARTEARRSETFTSGAVNTRATAVADLENLTPSRKFVTRLLNFFRFLPTEEGNQLSTALIAKHAANFKVQRFMELSGEGRTPFHTIFDSMRELAVPLTRRGGKFVTGDTALAAKYERALARDGVDRTQLAEAVARGGRLNEAEIQDAMILANEDQNFVMNVLTSPVWWDLHPVLRLQAKFKPFIMKQTGLLLNNTMKEAAHGNFAPAAKWIPVSIMAGEMVNVPLDIIRGRQNSILIKYLNDPAQLDEPEELALSMLEDMADGAGIGLFADILWGVDDFIGGPTLGSFQSLLELGGDVVTGARLTSGNLAERVASGPFRRQMVNAINDLLGREITLTNQVRTGTEAFTREFQEDNMLLEWSTFRASAFAFKADKEDPTLTEKGLREGVSFFTGKQDFPASDTSMSYRWAWNNITLGDIDDATTYLADVLGSARDNKQRSNFINTMKGQITKRSHFGMSTADYNQWLQTLPPDRASRARKLSAKFRQDALRAMGKAQQEERKRRQ